MKTKRVLVLGLGRFGSAVVEALWDSGAEVVAIDESAEAVDAVKERTSAVFVGDATHVKVIEGVARDIDAAVVSFGEAFEASALCVSTLSRLGVKEIVARAATDRRADILRRVGATRVIQVEIEMGRRVANDLTAPLAADLVDLASTYRVVPWVAQGGVAGRTLADANIRSRYNVNVIGVRRSDQAGDRAKRIEAPTPEYRITRGDTLLLVGEAKDVARFVATEAD
jgi:trk system potassium uptake protein TrkA